MCAVEPVTGHDALYWRFLYEQYGDVRILRVALEEMACRPVDDVPGVGRAGTLDEVMDAALAHLDGPFESFEQSLAAFAQANYALRLENGRCGDEGLASCAGRYLDPHRMYVAPAAGPGFYLHGASLDYARSIPASFGIDLTEIVLQGTAHSPMEVVVRSQGAQLDAQVWRVSVEGDELRALTPEPEHLVGDCRAGCRHRFSAHELAQADRLALIVVRLDADEQADGRGAYSIRLAG